MALVFLDLDGTTLDHGKPALGIVETIALLKQNGHTPVIATGRVPHLLYGVDQVLGIPDYIAANGSYIKFGGKVIYENYIPKTIVKRMIDTCDEHGFDLVLEGVNAYVATSKNSPIVDKFSDTFNIEYPVINRDYYLHNEVLAFIFFDQTRIDEIRTLFPELIFNQSNRFGYDVNLKGDLKADGIRWLINHLGISKDDVYAIGDGLNDVSMLQAVEHGIAMGNAHPNLKRIAKDITDDVDKEGVKKALLKYGLI
jgi:hypothetical protein